MESLNELEEKFPGPRGQSPADLVEKIYEIKDALNSFTEPVLNDSRRKKTFLKQKLEEYKIKYNRYF